MELYILDEFLRRIEVVDRYQSLIWTERFNSAGDFELTLRSTPQHRSLLQPGIMLAMSETDRIMKLETVEDGLDPEGRRTLKCTGPSLESILSDRVAIESLQGSVDANGNKRTWSLSGIPSAVARKIFHDICVLGKNSEYDKIPLIQESVIGVPSLIPEPIDPITIELEPQTVYEAISEICKVWNLGFRFQRGTDNATLYFNIYSGTDRTNSQTTVSSVLFTPELDNLTDIKEFHSIEASKNVAYVISPEQALMVYPNDVDPDDNLGWQRRVLVVKADDITSENTTDIPAALTQIGKSELAKFREMKAFDGQINQNSHYKYQKDYFLGDVVELRNIDGVANQMRVTEQIFVSDEQGERTYPTLELNKFVTTGSWLSWGGNKKWIDYDGEATTWADLP